MGDDRWRSILYELAEPHRFLECPGDGSDPRQRATLEDACKRIVALENRLTKCWYVLEDVRQRFRNHRHTDERSAGIRDKILEDVADMMDEIAGVGKVKGG